MDCRELYDLLPELLAADATSSLAPAARDHVAGCRACATLLEQHHRAWALLGVLADEPALPAQRLANLAQATLELARREGDGGDGGDGRELVVDAPVIARSPRRRLVAQFAAAALLMIGASVATRLWMTRPLPDPDFLADPDFQAHYELLRDLPDLDAQGDVLDADDDLLVLNALRGA